MCISLRDLYRGDIHGLPSVMLIKQADQKRLDRLGNAHFSWEVKASLLSSSYTGAVPVGLGFELRF